MDVHDTDLSGSTFTRVDLSRARFEQVELGEAFLRNVSLVGARLRGAWLERVDIDGELLGLTVNGVDVGPLVEAELDRRHPERVLVRRAGEEGADAVRTAWVAVRDAWGPVLERAQALPEPLLHRRVDDEYSFLETLRHLAFCTDAWLRRAVLLALFGTVAPSLDQALTWAESGEVTRAAWEGAYVVVLGPEGRPEAVVVSGISGD